MTCIDTKELEKPLITPKDRFIEEAIAHTQQALERMPIRSSTMARQMLQAGLPTPETHDDIERYIHNLMMASHTPK